MQTYREKLEIKRNREQKHTQLHQNSLCYNLEASSSKNWRALQNWESLRSTHGITEKRRKEKLHSLFLQLRYSTDRYSSYIYMSVLFVFVNLLCLISCVCSVRCFLYIHLIYANTNMSVLFMFVNLLCLISCVCYVWCLLYIHLICANTKVED